MNFKKATFFLMTIWFFKVSAAMAQPIMPYFSKPENFRFFNPTGASIPPQAAITSKGIIAMDSYHGSLGPVETTTGTAFLIRTFRPDNKVCMCMNGSLIKYIFDLSHGGLGFPQFGERINLNADIYMDYLGQDSVGGDGVSYTKVKGFAKSYLGHATVLAYVPGAAGAMFADAALLLVDKSQLPSALFATLGYEFLNNVWPDASYYTIGHPHHYPQRISDTMELTEIEDHNGEQNTVILQTQPPYAVARKSEGSPILLKQPLGGQGAAMAVAIVSDIWSGDLGEHNTFDFLSPKYEAGFSPALFSDGFFEYNRYNLRATKLKVLEAAIRKHCWNNSDSTSIDANRTYRQTVTVNNSTSTNPYSQNASISSSSGLATASAAVFSESTANLEITRLNSNICNITSFALPTTYPGSSKPWEVNIAAKEINVSQDFSYTASGNAQLELSTVIFQTSSASTINHQLPAGSDTSYYNNIMESSCKVYPNPSPSGMFYISLPDTGIYHVKIYSMDAKLVYQSRCNAKLHTVSLQGWAKGTYALSIYKGNGNEIIFKQLIIY